MRGTYNDEHTMSLVHELQAVGLGMWDEHVSEYGRCEKWLVGWVWWV